MAVDISCASQHLIYLTSQTLPSGFTLHFSKVRLTSPQLRANFASCTPGLARMRRIGPVGHEWLLRPFYHDRLSHSGSQIQQYAFRDLLGEVDIRHRLSNRGAMRKARLMREISGFLLTTRILHGREDASFTPTTT